MKKNLDYNIEGNSKSGAVWKPLHPKRKNPDDKCQGSVFHLKK
jgi:hypothetical protein